MVVFGLGCLDLTSRPTSFFNDTATTEIYTDLNTLSLHDALTIAMFERMSSLTTLDLSNFDTSKVTYMYDMFAGMSNLTTLDLSNFNTSNVTYMNYMFALPDKDKLKDKLETIYVNNDFNTTKLTYFTEMFKNRKKLRGGNGSYLADPSTADKTWLRVDRPGVQGYFTRKS